MKKIIATIAATALLAGAGTLAFAQTPGQGAPATGQQQERTEGRRGGLSQEDFSRLIDARIAAIKAGLKLTPDQERLWAPVESAIRANAAERHSRFQERREMREERRSMDFMQRLERRSTRVTENAQRMSTLATAMRPLWDTFTEDQKRIAPRLMRPVVAEGGMGWRERGGRRGGHHRDGEHGRMGGMMHGRGGMGHGPVGQQAPAQPAPQQ